MESSGVLFTVGYERRDVPGIVNTLQREGVETVVDVRQYPNSRRKGFSKSALTQVFAAAGIVYQSIPALGSPRDVRKRYRSTGDTTWFFEAFESHLDSQEGALHRLLEMVQEDSCCLLCYERDAEVCHRKAVAERIRTLGGNGLRIRHL